MSKPIWRDWTRTKATVLVGYQQRNAVWSRRTLYVSPCGRLFPATKLDTVWKARPQGFGAVTQTEITRDGVVVSWWSPLRRGHVTLRDVTLRG